MAAYWLNGTVTVLPAITSKNAVAESIAISGSDVYIAGYEWDSAKNNYVACYWKNGATAVEVSDGTEFAWATSIAVQE